MIIPVIDVGAMYLLCTSFFATHVLFHLQSPFFIPDLFTGRVFEAQSFCYGESALVNSCRDLVLPDNSAGQRYIGEEQSRRVKLFLTPQVQNALNYSASQLARVSLCFALTLTEVHQGEENILLSYPLQVNKKKSSLSKIHRAL